MSRTADVRLNFSAVGVEKVKSAFASVDAQRTRMNNSPVSIKMLANDKDASDKLSNIFRQVETLNHSKANISMKFDDYAQARAKLDDLKNRSRAIDGKVIRESIKIDGMGKAILDFGLLAKAQDEVTK